MDLTVVYRNISDESLVSRDGTVEKFKRYDFYIGKFGPFTERVKLDEFTDQAIVLRVNALKAHIQTVHR
jgi:hypothetical protein